MASAAVGVCTSVSQSAQCSIFDDQLARKSAQSADVAAVTNASDMSARVAVYRPDALGIPCA